jgi:dipeptidyl aminopeptidase/acylaminoacyl peptidase
VILQRDSLQALSWDPRQAIIELEPWYPTTNESGHLYFRRTPSSWVRVSGKQLAMVAPALMLDNGFNSPARLVAVDPQTHARHLVYDPNPGLLASYRFGRQDVVHWKTSVGTTWVGGLYWPPDFLPGRRYPLVIQTHGFWETPEFWAPYGIFSTGQAAQPLANAGVLVLQMPDPPFEQRVTPEEGPLFMKGAEAAIDHLDSLGLIDRTKVGMQGFSRTCFYTLYFLTHSSYPIAAATLSDGVDASYLQQMLLAPATYSGTGRVPEADQMNGGSPFGAALATWMQRAPGFNLDRVTTPLLLTALGDPSSLLQEWEPYAGMLLQAKPAEMIYIPDGAHVLIKPWERLTSQQGAVDWYRFWLKREEDPDPAKAGQYVRWRELRRLHEQHRARDTDSSGVGSK